MKDCARRSRSNPKVPAMSLQEYWDLLNTYDWAHGYTDSHEVYLKGLEQSYLVGAGREQSEVHRCLYEAFRDYIYSGPAFGRGRVSKPRRPV